MRVRFGGVAGTSTFVGRVPKKAERERRKLVPHVCAGTEIFHRKYHHVTPPIGRVPTHLRLKHGVCALKVSSSLLRACCTRYYYCSSRVSCNTAPFIAGTHATRRESLLLRMYVRRSWPKSRCWCLRCRYVFSTGRLDTQHRFGSFLAHFATTSALFKLNPRSNVRC